MAMNHPKFGQGVEPGAQFCPQGIERWAAVGNPSHEGTGAKDNFLTNPER